MGTNFSIHHFLMVNQWLMEFSTWISSSPSGFLVSFLCMIGLEKKKGQWMSKIITRIMEIALVVVHVQIVIVSWRSKGLWLSWQNNGGQAFYFYFVIADVLPFVKMFWFDCKGRNDKKCSQTLTWKKPDEVKRESVWNVGKSIYGSPYIL